MTFRPRIAVTLLLSLALTIPAMAAKRRAGNETPIVTIHGTVTDENTGQPVAFAELANADRSAITDAQGKFTLRVSSGRPTQIIVTRSGYETKIMSLTAAEGQTVAATLKTGAVVLVKMIDGTNYSLDFDVTQFAYAIPFSDYGKSDFANLCTATTEQYRPLKTEIKKVTGPAVSSPGSCCSPSGNALKAKFELKNGTTTDAYFADNCFGYDVLLLGRDHTTGKFRYLSWTKIAEAVFP
ncbi:MAG TPA: carboxypeptidase regulatory-like domain-containing protein [Thermoanaerobaculia bacterium]|nr:carboxypeptidase regulatory-like domain-containing protein [Thermoanaerobaculia bacterium]